MNIVELEASLSHEDNFICLTRLRDFISVELSENHVKALNVFNLGEEICANSIPLALTGFSFNIPGVKKNHFSISSSVSCLNSLLLSHEHRSRLIRLDYSKFQSTLKNLFKQNRIKSAGLHNLNPFTVGILLSCLKNLGFNETDDIVMKCVEISEKMAKKDGFRINEYPQNGYLTYYNLVGMQEWNKKIESNLACIQWSKNELFKQISYFHANEYEKSDPYELGYNLLIQYHFNRNTLSPDIIDLALKTLFSAKLKRGVWEKKQPLFIYADYGDAYCFTFEFLNALFNEFRSEYSFLIKFNDSLIDSVRWICRNRQIINNISIYSSGNRFDSPYEAESWATAEVYSFLQRFYDYLTWNIQVSILKEIKHIPHPKPDATAFDDLLQPSVFIDGKEELLFAFIKREILEQYKIDDTNEYSLVKKSNKKLVIRSGILFGPPGTGKTTIVKRIAKYLGWPIIILDPSDFAKDGMPFVTHQTSKIFDKLLELQDTVILFDEMEEMLKARRHPVGSDEGEFSTFEQKFLTTSLLPKLQNLHDKAGSLFIISTNYFNDLDEAAKREGRFDFVFQVLPPCFEEKKKKLSEELPSLIFTKLEMEMLRFSTDENNIFELLTRRELAIIIKESLSKPDFDLHDFIGRFDYRLKKDRRKINSEKKKSKIQL
ncbi:MAG TPA: ATP-binding protein [Candidatus Cloacimonadota bacterium]|nr:ATP-binding protein [Candidatus Cloacimonadota bacterium]